MKTIGLIGGMSWQSSDLYYQTINRKVQEAMGGVHSCDCLMYSVDFDTIAKLQKAGDWQSLAALMIKAAKRLQSGGADFVLICANTMHKVAAEVQQNIDIPLLHIVDATAEAVQAKGLKKLGLIATKYSMEQDFLTGRYKEKFGIETIVPDQRDRDEIHRIIYEELVKGIINESSRQCFLKIIDTLVQQGAEGIIAGCTEVELLIKPQDINIDLFETARLHAEKAVAMALH